MTFVNNKYGTNFGYNSIGKALRNEMICGSYKGNPNYCKPYITREMFDKLQVILKKNPRTTEGDHAYIFTGLIRCPDCGRRLVGTPEKRHTKKKGLIRVYQYRCNKYRMDKSCTFGRSIPEKKLEQEMLSRIEHIIEQQEVRNVSIKEKAKKVSKYNVEELQEELDRLNYAWRKGRIKKVEDYDRDYEKLTARIEAANAELADIAQTVDLEKVKSVLSSGWKGIYKELDDEHKRAFWRSFVEEIVVEWTKEHKEIKDIQFF
jgi:hypothetical protein